MTVLSIRFAVLGVGLALLVGAAAGCRRDKLSARDGGASPDTARPAATRHDRGVAAIELAEGAPIVPSLPFLTVHEALHHARRVQRLEAIYCSAEAPDVVKLQLDSALAAGGWQASGGPPSKQDAGKIRIVARRDRFRLSFTVASSVGGACAGAGQTSVHLVLFKVSGET